MTWEALQNDPSFWVAVSFVIFVAAFGRTLWKRLADVLDARRESIRSEIAAARKLRDDAQEMLNDHVRRRKSAEEEAEVIIERAREQAKRLVEERSLQLEAQLERARERTRREIESAQEAAISDYRERLSSLVVRATETLLRNRQDQDTHTALVERTIADISQVFEKTRA